VTSRARRSTLRDPLLLEIAAAIGAGNIEIGPIHSDREFVHGVAYTKTGRIRINPAVDVVDTALHECCHRLRPHWSERTVKARATRLMAQMSLAEIDKLYEVLLTTAKVKKRPELI
jgi:hypothetical protein